MSLVLLFYRAAAAAGLSTVYGADLFAWWFDSYTTGSWTDDIGGANATQATASYQPSADTTPASHTAVAFDAVVNQGDSLLATFTAPGGTTSAQFGCGFYVSDPSATRARTIATLNGATPIVLTIDAGALTVTGSGVSLTSGVLSVGWHWCVVDMRGGDGAVWLYVDSPTAVDHDTGIVVTDFAPFFSAAQFGSDTVLSGYPTFKLASAYLAFKSTDFTLDTTAQAAGVILHDYIGGYLEERPPPVWFPTPTDIRRPRYDAHLQLASVYDFAAANPAFTPVALTEYPTVPQRPTPRTSFQAFATSPAPERSLAATDVSFPDFARRPALAAANQLPATTEPPQPERTSPLAAVEHPASVRRPFYPTPAQQAVTGISPQPERTIAATDVSWPDFARRPFFNVSLQLAVTELAPRPERTSPLADVSWPDFVRKPYLATASQLAVTSEPPQPERVAPLADTDWPDFVRRPTFAPANQLAATEISPAPERIAPLADVEWPDRPSRALVGPWAYPSIIDTAWPVPSPTVGYADFPAAVYRPKYDAARQHAATTEPATPPATVVAPTEGYAIFPDYVIRFKMAASEQLAVTGEPPQPERQAPLADVEWPDFAKRPFFAVAQQLAATSEPPQPERQAPLADVEWPDFARRPFFAASQQLAATEETPRPERTSPLTDVSWPDFVKRPFFAVSTQQGFIDPAYVAPSAFVQTTMLGWHADSVYRPKYLTANQLAEVEPRRERTAPLEWAEFPDRVIRPKVLPAHQPFVSVSNIRPERQQPAFDVGFPDFARKPHFATSMQQAFVEPRLERTAPGIEPSFPDFARRPFFFTANQLAITELSPAPERKAPLAASIFPDAVYRPKYLAANQYYYAAPDPELARARQPVTQFPVYFPDRVIRPFYPVTEQPYLSSGISVFLASFAPTQKGGQSFSINQANARVSIANGHVTIRSTGSKVRE